MSLRIISLIRKEFLHILRDPRTLFVMFLMPVVQLVLLGYAATTDIEHLRTAVIDSDKSEASRELIDAYRASNYFDIVLYVESERQLEYLIDNGQVKAGLIIPAGYEQEVSKATRLRPHLSLTAPIPVWRPLSLPAPSRSGRHNRCALWSG